MEGFVEPLWGTGSAHRGPYPCLDLGEMVFFWDRRGTTRKNKGLKYGLVLK
jgi:hypothetical protein